MSSCHGEDIYNSSIGSHEECQHWIYTLKRIQMFKNRTADYLQSALIFFILKGSDLLYSHIFYLPVKFSIYSLIIKSIINFCYEN